MAGTYSVSFLGDDDREEFAAAARYNPLVIWEFDSSDVRKDLRDQFGPAWYDSRFPPGSADAAGSTGYSRDNVPGKSYVFDRFAASPTGEGIEGGATVSITTGQYMGEWGYYDGDPFELQLGYGSVASIETFTSSETIGAWFIVGGRFNGAKLEADETITATLPDADPLTDWLLAA